MGSCAIPGPIAPVSSNLAVAAVFALPAVLAVAPVSSDLGIATVLAVAEVPG